MAGWVQNAKGGSVSTEVDETGWLSSIERHRKAVLSSPFILAVLLGVMYLVGGNEFRQVLDFMSPGRILGH